MQLGYDKARQGSGEYDYYLDFQTDYVYYIECSGNEDNVGQCALTWTSTINTTMWGFCGGYKATATCSKTGTFESHNEFYYHYFSSSSLDRFIF